MSKRSILIHAVGDIMLGDHPLTVGRGVHSTFHARPPHFPFAHVAPILSAADLAFCNLECTLSQIGLRVGDYHSMQLRGQLSYADSLRGAGFQVVCVANNHSMQHGREAFTETVDALRGAGIRVCGLASATYRSVVPVLVEMNGLRIAFFGWSLRPRRYFAAGPLYAEGYPDDMLRDVRAARRSYDCVVVSLHWGDEYIDRPSPMEIRLARQLMDAGADLIIGHHPHVLRGCERYGRGWIIYSLGNFVSDMTWSERLCESAIAKCRLTPSGVDELELVPVKIADDFRPMPLEGEEATAIRKRLQDLSNDLAHATSDDLDSERLAAAYRMSAAIELALERRRSRLHFLRNLHRRPAAVLAQQLSTFVRNRIAERG